MLFHSSVGSVALTASDSTEGDTERRQGSKSRIAGVTFEGRPNKIELAIEVAVGKETSKVYLVKDGKAQEIAPGTFTDFVVPVKWSGDVPSTRQKGVDNVDVIIMESTGRFMDFQCSLITRRGKFFLAIDQIFIGYVVRTRGDNNAVKMEFLPACGRIAYPGFSYEAVWSGMAEAIVGEAKAIGFSQRKSTVKEVGKGWRPPEISKEADGKGWKQAVVLYFNMVTGTGLIQDGIGTNHFVHFNNIQDGGSVPTLTPCTAVLFKPGTTKPGQAHASVNAVKEMSAEKPAAAVAASQK